jgi:predicted nucleic acid-binding protein
MARTGKKDIFKEYKNYLKKDPKLLKIMKQLGVDQEAYLDALYQMENNKIIPDRIYTDTTFQK